MRAAIYATNHKIVGNVDFNDQFKPGRLPEGMSVDQLAFFVDCKGLHEWMEKLYHSKGGKLELFHSAPVRLTLEDIAALEKEPKIYSPVSLEPLKAAINNKLAVYYEGWL